MNLKIDYSNCLNFLGEDEIYSLAEKCRHHLNSLLKADGAGNDYLGWITLPEEVRDVTEKIKLSASRLQQQANITVVIGIGGSYLGSKAVLEALEPPFELQENRHHIIYAGHHLSEDYHAGLIKFLKDRSFNIVVISKSGTTTEPAIAFRILKNLLESNIGKEKSVKHIIAITDKSKGALRSLATLEGYETYVIPDNIGGRYSVLTPVGLLPIAIAGYNISDLVSGASDMASSTRDNSHNDSNIALLYAAIRNLLYKKGYLIEMLVNYEPSVHYIGEWWKQLFGESEGKDGKGIFPASADFTTDLHSLGQYIQEGDRILFETVISIDRGRESLVIPEETSNLDNLNFVAGKRISEVNHKAEEGTIMAHVDGGVPNIRIIIPEINEHTLGQLLYFFELSCAISGYELNINPFDQPGVEEYKRNMFKLLGKEGY